MSYNIQYFNTSNKQQIIYRTIVLIQIRFEELKFNRFKNLEF